MQVQVIVFAVLAILAMGAAITFAVHNNSDRRVTVWEFVFVAALSILVITPSVDFLATSIAKASKIGGYHEFLNGSVTAASQSETQCSEDGSCRHTYDCDPYLVPITTTDSKGRSSTTYVTDYHQCPYATVEYSYWVDTSLGSTLSYGDHIFGANSQSWRGGEGLPTDIPRGVPAGWISAKAHLAAGNADPITQEHTYDNYILSSSTTLLKNASNDIATYKNANLLPAHTQNIDDPVSATGQANKLTFVSMNSPSNAGAWEDALNHLNAALGTQLQGDMHVVVIPASKVSDPDGYVRALIAYWQGPDLDKNALSKNGIALVIGLDTSGNTISWARAKTGMPVGNNGLLDALSSNLMNKPFTIDAVFGQTKAQVSNPGPKVKPKFIVGNGVVAQDVLVNQPFARVCMNCSSAADKGKGTGFVYLTSDFELGTGGQILVLALILVLSGGVWAAAIYFQLFHKTKSVIRTGGRSYRGYY